MAAKRSGPSPALRTSWATSRGTRATSPAPSVSRSLPTSISAVPATMTTVSSAESVWRGSRQPGGTSSSELPDAAPACPETDRQRAVSSPSTQASSSPSKRTVSMAQPLPRADRLDTGAVLFELRDVTASRGAQIVLDRLTLDLAEGATAVVGPSGCGKSTLLRLLNRLADPDAGEIRFRGRDVRELDPLALRREVALVPQLPALLPGTVAENLRFAAELAGRAPDGRVLALAGLDASFAERPASR